MIRINLDVMLAKRKMSLTELAEKVGITLANLSPVFTPEQEVAKRRELEQQLYEVFRKYADKRQKEEAGA